MTTAAPSKQKLRGTARDDIIAVSRAIIEDEGVAQLTIRRIAETIHRTQPAVYQHFSSKDALLEAVVTDGFTALAERLTRATRGGKASLPAIANAYVGFGRERPRLYDVMFVGPPAITFAAGAATPIPAHTAFHIIAAAVAESGVPAAQTETVTEVVWASLHGLVTLSITRRLRPGRALQQTRLDQLIAAIVAMTAST
ncbi:MAG: TetR/AcrR family transcriptional regulator [Herpetosiphonaceae bacterium]|nr:TetR/AcrR family transcriptional regulator [Herpetosiphonaceae bacterium]